MPSITKNMTVKILFAVVLSIAVVASLCVMLLFLLLSVSSKKEGTQEAVITAFERNRSSFENVIHYYKIGNIDSSISFDSSTRKFPVEISDDIKLIFFKLSFESIYCQNNYIVFIRDRGFQWHRSIIYNKENNTIFENRTREIKQLDKCWFYYYGE